MQQGDLKPVEIHILGKSFPLKVTGDEAIWVTSLENEINDKIASFQETYPSLDKLDCTIMTLLTYAFENKHHLSNKTSKNDNDVDEKLDDLLQMLSEH
ncbi:MAG: cell division protein ZapA [Saprospiraceae bacterium]